MGLCADGTVFVTGTNNSDGQQNVQDWTDIVDISSGPYYTIGLKSDGTVVSTLHNAKYDVSGWKNIVSISGGYDHMLGLTADGTVVAVGNNEYGQCDVSQWTDIVAISAGNRHSLGLRSDGTIVATGDDTYDQCSLSGCCFWYSNRTDAVQIAAGYFDSVMLFQNGCVGSTLFDPDVSGWEDVAAVYSVGRCVIGLREDGTLLYAGRSSSGTNTCTKWEGIALP